ncbi:hypothetical protein FQR65_LT15764 [Abscondita terminalis]|nr:hypothetical protein FQR65_LT15764 [Abscondita terminalis]
MTEFATFTCNFCHLEDIKPDVRSNPNNDLVPNFKLELPSEDVSLSINQNPVACDKCKTEIDETYRLHMQNKNLIKEEFVLDSIKMEVFVEEDIPLSIPVNIVYCYECSYGTNDQIQGWR